MIKVLAVISPHELWEMMHGGMVELPIEGFLTPAERAGGIELVLCCAPEDQVTDYIKQLFPASKISEHRMGDN